MAKPVPFLRPNPTLNPATPQVLGLQLREVSALEESLGLPSNQVLALFNKAMRKVRDRGRAGREGRQAGKDGGKEAGKGEGMRHR